MASMWKNKEVIKTLLKLWILKPYKETVVTGDDPSPHVIDLTLSRQRIL